MSENEEAMGAEEEKSIREQLRALLSQYNIPAADLEKDLQVDQAAVGPEQLPPPTEEMLVLGRTHYMLKDNDIRNLVFGKHRWLIPAYIAASHLLRTSFLDPWDVEPLKWRFKLIIDLLLMSKDDLSIEDLAVAEAMYIYGFTSLKDALDGWRGKLVTEQVRTYRIEGEKVEKDRRRWWERIFGR